MKKLDLLLQEKQVADEDEHLVFLFFCLQLYTSAAPLRPSWTSWNCFKVRSRTQKTMPFSTWMCLLRAWWIANHGRTPTQTGSIPSRSSRYSTHTRVLMGTHVQYLTTACISLDPSSKSSECNLILCRFRLAKIHFVITDRKESKPAFVTRNGCLW